MQCEKCGESAVTRRDDEYLCGRCALRADWEDVALTAQGVAILQAAAPVQEAAPAVPPIAAAPAGSNLPPADPFAS